MIHIFIGTVLITVFWLIDWSFKARNESTDVIQSSLQNDFERTCRDIESCPYEADWFIDQFEQRWVSYLTHRELKHYIGRLIKKQVEYA
jgi:hypothetical protein